MKKIDEENAKRRWESAIGLLTKFHQAGFEAYIVGGAVRDYLLGKNAADIDITTNAGKTDLFHLFPNTIIPSNRFETALIRFKDFIYEVTPFRGSRLNIEEDLGKRDFTMNAMAFDKEERLVDPFAGKNDVEKGIIRAVGQADHRFNEDPLRIIRAYRFVSQFGWNIEQETLISIKQRKSELKSIAVERIRNEIDLCLSGNYHAKSLAAIWSERLSIHFPDVIKSEPSPVKSSALFHLDKLKTRNEKRAAFYWCLYEDEALLRIQGWKLPNNDKKQIKRLLEAARSPAVEYRGGWGLYHAGLETALQMERFQQWIARRPDAETLKNIKKEYERLPIKSRQDLLVSGSDIMHLVPGISHIEIGKLLNKLERKVLSRQLANDYHALADFIKVEVKK